MSLGQGCLQDAADLVEREAQLLDERRFDEWLSLFTEDGWYWVPASWDQQSPDESLSLVYEDKRLLALRVRRLASPMIHVEQPPSRTNHHLSGVSGRLLDDGTIEVRSVQLIVMFRDSEQRLFSARCLHRLAPRADGIAIVSKTVRLLDCDAAHRGLAVPL